MTNEQAQEIALNALESFVREHDYPCDGLREVGECFLCQELEQMQEAYKMLGRKWPFKKYPKRNP